MILVPSPEPQLSSYGTSPTERSPEPSRLLDEQHTPDSGGRTDEEAHNTTSPDNEDLSRDTGPVEVVLADLNTSDHRPDLSGDSLEETQQPVEVVLSGREPQDECDGEQAAEESLAEVRATTAEERDDSKGKPPASHEEPLDLAGNTIHKPEIREGSGEPPPAMDEGREKEGEDREQAEEKDSKEESELQQQYEEDEEREDEEEEEEDR